MVSVSCTFVYNAVAKRYQNRYRFLGKTATIDKCTVNLKGFFYSLLDWPIAGEDFTLNLSTVDKCKLKLWLQM